MWLINFKKRKVIEYLMTKMRREWLVVSIVRIDTDDLGVLKKNKEVSVA